MIKLGQLFPAFQLKGVTSSASNDPFLEINNDSHPGKWRVFFFWPKDFTFVCPTEIAEFGKLHQAFLERDTELLGVSIDSEFVHLAWKQQKDELRDLSFPMLSDIK